MSNHYHLLATTPNSDIDRFMYFFNKEFSLQLRRETDLKNRMMGGRYKFSIIKTEIYLLRVFRYILQNPLRAGMCGRIEEYPYSTLNYQIENKKFILPIDKNLFDVKNNLEWLNEGISEEQSLSIRNGLSHPYFDIHPKK